MKPIRMVWWLLLLHHIPGVCAPDDEEHSSDGRIRHHLLGGTATDVVADARKRMVAALEREVNYGADVLAWAAREAIERVPAAHHARLHDTLSVIQETFKRQAEKIQRQAIENTKRAKRRL